MTTEAKYPDPPSTQIVWHDSPESAQRAMWTPIAEAEGLTVDDLMDGELGGFDEDGNDVEPITTAQACEAIRETGCWGFCDTNTGIIHAWKAEDANPVTVMHMLAHEVGHLTGVAEEDAHAEEMRAEQFGKVAAEAASLYFRANAFQHRATGDVRFGLSCSDEELARDWLDVMVVPIPEEGVKE